MNEVLKEICGNWRDDESMGWGELNKKGASYQVLKSSHYYI
jgi:hypothetical protein